MPQEADVLEKDVHVRFNEDVLGSCRLKNGEQVKIDALREAAREGRVFRGNIIEKTTPRGKAIQCFEFTNSEDRVRYPSSISVRFIRERVR